MYRYVCPDGHQQKEYRERSDRMMNGVCEHRLRFDPSSPGAIPICGKPTVYADAPKPRAPLTASIRNQEQLSGKAWHRFKCEVCGAESDLEFDLHKNPDALIRKYDCNAQFVMVHDGTTDEGEHLTVMRDENNEVTTKVCAGKTAVLLTAAVRTYFNRMYPTGYLDRGLGVYVRNEDHRQAEMDRQGVAEVGDSFELSMDNNIRAVADQHQRVADEYDEVQTMMDRDKTANIIRQATESGQLKEEQKKRDVRYHGRGASWKRQDEVKRILDR